MLQSNIVSKNKAGENELLETFKIDVTNLQPGVYYLHIDSADFSTMKK